VGERRALRHRPLPGEGDVIVFENPITGQDYIKRVVGIPGDVIELKDDRVYLNGHVVPAQLADRHVEVWDRPEDSPWRLQHPDLWKETLGGKEHDILLDEGLRTREAPTSEPIRVPPNSVFVMGDNRDNSLDSRFGLGGPRRAVVFVPYGNIKGKAMIIWLSLSHGGLLSGLFGDTGLRTERFFRQVR